MRDKLQSSGTPFELAEHSASVERPSDLGQRAWDQLQRERPLMDESTARAKPGWGAAKRKEDQLKWAYPFVTPDMLRGELPSDLAAVRHEVLGDLIRDEAGAVRLKAGFHPVMNRWCEFTMVRRPDLGEAGQLWQVVYIYMEDPKPGELPADLQSDIARRHYRGLIGAYALPTRKDFENIRQFGARHEKLGSHMDRLERLSAPLNARETDMERVMDDRARDVADYSANHEIDMANRRAGTGWHMRETWIDNKGPDATGYKVAAERYKSTQKEGYRIIEKKSREEWEKENKDLVAEIRADQGLSTGKRRQEKNEVTESVDTTTRKLIPLPQKQKVAE